MKGIIRRVKDWVLYVLLVVALAAVVVVLGYYLYFMPRTESGRKAVMSPAVSSESSTSSKQPEKYSSSLDQPTRLVINVRKPQ